MENNKNKYIRLNQKCTKLNLRKAFVVHDIKVIESQNGLFIAMPSKKAPNGEFRDIAHPINAETREKIQKAILEAYEAPETEESAE